MASTPWDEREQERNAKLDIQQERIFGTITDPSLAHFVKEQRAYTGFNFMDDFDSYGHKKWKPITAVKDLRALELLGAAGYWGRKSDPVAEAAYNRYMVEQARWGYENCKGEWERYITHWWAFELKEDALMFKLMWASQYGSRIP